MSTPAKIHVSRNRLEGSLEDTPLPRLLESCRRHLFTGTIRVTTDSGPGVVHLRAGIVDAASTNGLVGDAAVESLARAIGLYELQQRLPDLQGELGSSAQLEGEFDDVPLAALMRHCEDHALSCSIIVVQDFDRGEVVYRGGEIVDVVWNGRHDLDAIVSIVELPRARFRVIAAPLDLGIEGWPSVSREPTAPFRIEQVAATLPKKKAKHKKKSAEEPAQAAPPPTTQMPRPRPVPAIAAITQAAATWGREIAIRKARAARDEQRRATAAQVQAQAQASAQAAVIAPTAPSVSATMPLPATAAAPAPRAPKPPAPMRTVPRSTPSAPLPAITKLAMPKLTAPPTARWSSVPPLALVSATESYAPRVGMFARLGLRMARAWRPASGTVRPEA